MIASLIGKFAWSFFAIQKSALSLFRSMSPRDRKRPADFQRRIAVVAPSGMKDNGRSLLLVTSLAAAITLDYETNSVTLCCFSVGVLCGQRCLSTSTVKICFAENFNSYCRVLALGRLSSIETTKLQRKPDRLLLLFCFAFLIFFL